VRRLTRAALVLALALMLIAAALHARHLIWSHDASLAQSATQDFVESFERFRHRHGRLPGDLNGDGEIDAGVHQPASVAIAGHKVTLRAVSGRASAVHGFPPHVRNVLELHGLPCNVAEELDARTDDGRFATGNTRASVTHCTVGGANDPVPVVAVALW
jgi:hypothetical protein